MKNKNHLPKSVQHIRFRTFFVAQILCLLVINFQLLGQISITYTQIKNVWGKPGGMLKFYQGPQEIMVNVGKSGGPNIYDFRSASFVNQGQVTLFSVADVPLLRGHFPDSAVTFGESPQNIRDNPVFHFEQDSMFEIGYSWITAPFDSLLYGHYIPRIPDFGGFPLTYNKTWSYSTLVAETTYVLGFPPITNYDVFGVTLTVDGHGTLKIPGHDLECLRIKLVESGLGIQEKKFWFVTREGALLSVESSTAFPDTGDVFAYDFFYILGGNLVGISNENLITTQGFMLSQNYPNPFNPSTKISWQSPVGSWQTLKVYDVLGNEIAKLVDEWKEAGKYSVDFDASRLASDIYFYKLTANDLVEVKKMVLVK